MDRDAELSKANFGAFYVQEGECMMCGAPEAMAPDLMSHDDGRCSCVFVRQPSTEAELDRAILAVWASCCGAVRYRGVDRTTLVRIAELGCGDHCDFRLTDEPPQAIIKFLKFAFDGPPQDESTASYLLGRVLSKVQCIGEGGTVEFRASADHARLRYAWGNGNPGSRDAVRARIERLSRTEWLMEFERESGHPVLTFLELYQKVLDEDRRYRDARWFTEKEWRRTPGRGRLKPW